MANPSRIKRTLLRLDSLLGQSARSRDPEESMEAGDFRIDMQNHQATVRGACLHLSAAEFDLLVFLVKHPRKLISPRTLLTTRWSSDHVRQTEFLPLLMGLRKKIMEVGGESSHYLRTEPWIFYRFETTRDASEAGPASAAKSA